MEPITFTAIGAALSAGVAACISKVGESALVDAYQGLKAALKHKFGDGGRMLEKRPNSEGRQVTLKEEVERTNLDQDPEVRQAAQDLLNQVKAQPSGEQHVQSAIGSYIAQPNRSSIATVSVEQPRKLPEE